MLISVLLIQTAAASAQLYLRGEVKDENNNSLSNAKILLHSSGYLYHSGSMGSFGINLPNRFDSITVSLSGYQTVTVQADATKYLVLQLKVLRTTAVAQQNRLMSFTKDLQLKDRSHWLAGGETYSTLVENEFVESKKYPETGFAIRIDKASYSNIRRFLNMDTKVPPDAVRIEEMMNYFNFGYATPVHDSIFSISSHVSDCPWNSKSQLLFLQVCARKIDPEKIPQSNLVFLVDISGSMDLPNRLPLLKSAFKLLVDNLREIDTMSIVVYGSTVGVWLPPTSGKEKVKIRKAIEELYPGGSTPGQSGILSAYRLAKSQFIKGGNNRVILATDGDFNVGQTTEEELEKLITSYQESGIYLTCLGVGMGNYKDSKLEVLAKKGNGNFSYLDNEEEAEKVLVKEFTQNVYSVADDASLSIKFNDDFVKEYRLIGFDNKLKALSDSIMDIEGGEVGSGHSMVAVLEIVPTVRLGGALQFTKDLPIITKDIAQLSVSYRLPGDSIKRFSGYGVQYNYSPFSDLPASYKFASSVVMFGSLLKESPYAKNITWNETIIAANEYCDKTDPAQKEFVAIIEKAKKIYSKRKKRFL
ncbi:MAG: von Willebrand factor type A domain-containing protein [Chitinophagaceae bacterium]|nr:von Willebrand factor type A domain-containing protein [Chitinophagaceae bacterium]